MKVPIIYASASGNVESVCEYVSNILQTHTIGSHLTRAELASIEILQNNSILILATSTWHHGEINPFFDSFLASAKDLNFEGKTIAYIGLGDSRYEPHYFCNGIVLLEKFFSKRGAQTLAHPLKIDGAPYKSMESCIVPWIETLVPLLLNTSKP